MNEEVLYSIALTRALPMNFTVQNILLDQLGSAKSVYENRRSLRDVLPDASDKLVAALSRMEQYLSPAEKAILFSQKRDIECICKADNRYPARLRECKDAPILLFYRGTANLNAPHIISMVGTRYHTEGYGEKFCIKFLCELRELCPDTLVVSGLALGIDIAAHRAAMDCGLPTMGVLAHGMDTMWPPYHREDAIRMEKNGGVITEYTPHYGTKRVNFVSRNRIVAGLSDATIVVQSPPKGGSLITAGIANAYEREVFSVPWQIYDERSAGCNALIRDNKANLLFSAEDFALRMGWIKDAGKKKKKPTPDELFANLTEQEKAVVTCLKKDENNNGKDTNQLCSETNIPYSRLASLLFDLDMKGAIKEIRGGRYILW